MNIKNKDEVWNILENVKYGKTSLRGARDRIVDLLKAYKRDAARGILGDNISNISYGLLTNKGKNLLERRFPTFEEAVGFAQYNVGESSNYYDSYIVCKIIEYRDPKH